MFTICREQHLAPLLLFIFALVACSGTIKKMDTPPETTGTKSSMASKIKLPELAKRAKDEAVAAKMQWDPYEYRARNEKSFQYFKKLLPKSVLSQLEKLYPNYAYLTSCTAEFDDSGQAGFGIGLVEAGNQLGHVFYAEASSSEQKGLLIDKIESHYIGSEPLKIGVGDYIEVYCREITEGTIGFGGRTINQEYAHKVRAVLMFTRSREDGLEILIADKANNVLVHDSSISPP
jgi:hypothetical protein